MKYFFKYKKRIEDWAWIHLEVPKAKPTLKVKIFIVIWLFAKRKNSAVSRCLTGNFTLINIVI